MTDIRFVGKIPLATAAVNAELPPFKNGEHNSENASIIDRVITPLRTHQEHAGDCLVRDLAQEITTS